MSLAFTHSWREQPIVPAVTHDAKGIYQQLIAITKRCGIEELFLLPNCRFVVGKQFYDKAVLRPLGRMRPWIPVSVVSGR